MWNIGYYKSQREAAAVARTFKGCKTQIIRMKGAYSIRCQLEKYLKVYK